MDKLPSTDHGGGRPVTPRGARGNSVVRNSSAARSGSRPRSRSPLPRNVVRGNRSNSNPVAKNITDHIIGSTKRISPKDYPDDCPPVLARWHYAVDNPKKKPFQKESDAKTQPKPAVKFVPFGEQDSRNIETAFWEMSEKEDAKSAREAEKPWTSRRRDSDEDGGDLGGAVGGAEEEGEVTVPVNEDYLFDVHIRKRELTSAYWEGPVYSVLRGTWFRDGYIKFKPYRQKTPPPSTAPPTTSTDTSKKLEVPSTTEPAAPVVTDLFAGSTPGLSQQGWPLLGPWLNSFVVYVDATTAWLMTDDIYGKISSTLYQRMTSGQNLGGIKIIRGWVDKTPAPTKPATSVSGSRPVTPTPGKSGGSKRSSLIVDQKKTASPKAPGKEEEQNPTQIGRMALERKMSNLLGIGDEEDPEKVMEEEMKEDYKNSDENENDREVEHL
ncbi:hypothetical protein AA313_de0200012 [Arthrobotrys entomopaga]|nr:hypothetical protein AA313_de0200012 [Arthrobotrys entomopaga]